MHALQVLLVSRGAVVTALAVAPQSARQRHFDYFDAVANPVNGYSSSTLMDDPAAADSLRDWAALHGYSAEFRAYDDWRALVVRAPNFEIAVQLRVGCSNCGHQERKA